MHQDKNTNRGYPQNAFHKLVILFYLLVAGFQQPAQAQIYDIDWGNEGYHRITRPDSLFLHLKQQYNIALQKGNDAAQGITLEKMGELCFHMGQFPQALEYYLDATKCFRKTNDANRLAYSYLDIGILSYYNRDTFRANDYFQQALAMFRKQSDAHGLALTYGNIGFSFEKKQAYDSAYHYQMLALQAYRGSKDTSRLAKIYENIGSIYEDLEQYDSAMHYFNKSLELYEQSPEKAARIEVLNNIGDIYRKTNRYRQALTYSFTAIKISHELDELYQLSSGYRDVAKAYSLMNQHDSAFFYLELSRKYLLDIYSRESSQQMAFLEVQDDARKKNEEIERLHNAQQISRIITFAIVVIVLLVIILVWVMWNRQQLKIRNERSLNEQHKKILETRGQLMEADLKAHHLEEEQLKSQLLAGQLEKEKLDTQLKNNMLEETLLKEQIEVKTRELSTNTLHVIQKNQLLEQLKNQIEVLVNDDKRDQKKQLKQLLTLINQNFNNESYWVEFKNTFEQIHHSFFEELKKVCPDLSASELRLVCLLKMNMNSGDMATILGISPDSLRVARYRLRKKLNIEQGSNLMAFLQNL
jgi:DNA-binding CsgD family transcriptional regulator